MHFCAYSQKFFNPSILQLNCLHWDTVEKYVKILNTVMFVGLSTIIIDPISHENIRVYESGQKFSFQKLKFNQLKIIMTFLRRIYYCNNRKHAHTF